MVSRSRIPDENVLHASGATIPPMIDRLAPTRDCRVSFEFATSRAAAHRSQRSAKLRQEMRGCPRKRRLPLDRSAVARARGCFLIRATLVEVAEQRAQAEVAEELAQVAVAEEFAQAEVPLHAVPRKAVAAPFPWD